MANVSGVRTMMFPLQKSMQRNFRTSAVVNKIQSGRYKPTPTKNKPLTYEMFLPPHYIAHRKSWNSWNTSNLYGGNRPSETAIEDIFIRKFITGTWANIFLSEIIIKRQHNIIRIAGLINPTKLATTQMYFLIGYTEEFLSCWLQCIVKMEIVTTPKFNVAIKYI